MRKIPSSLYGFSEREKQLIIGWRGRLSAIKKTNKRQTSLWLLRKRRDELVRRAYD